MWPRYKEAVLSGEYNPMTGKTDVEQHEEVEDTDVDMTKPSKGAVKVTLRNRERVSVANARCCRRMVRSARVRHVGGAVTP